jgi:hypothetical protein
MKGPKEMFELNDQELEQVVGWWISLCNNWLCEI